MRLRGGAVLPVYLGRMEAFQFTPGQRFEVTPEVQKRFDRDGYIMVRLSYQQSSLKITKSLRHLHTQISDPRE